MIYAKKPALSIPGKTGRNDVRNGDDATTGHKTVTNRQLQNTSAEPRGNCGVLP
jgi:hypothetical protein